jgi:hypothetical protein
VGAPGAPENLGEGILAFNKIDKKLYVGTDDPAAPEVIGGKGEFVDLGSEQSVTGKKNFTAATVSSAPSGANDVVRKTELDEVSAAVAALGNALNYVGTINGGADLQNAYDLSTLAEKDAGDYYKVGTSGHFVYTSELEATTLFANSGDGLVFNLDGGIDKIDNTNSTVTGTANEIAVSGSTDTGFTVAIDPVFSGRVSTLESGLAQEIQDRTDADTALGDRVTDVESKTQNIDLAATTAGSTKLNGAFEVDLMGPMLQISETDLILNMTGNATTVQSWATFETKTVDAIGEDYAGGGKIGFKTDGAIVCSAAEPRHIEGFIIDAGTF